MLNNRIGHVIQDCLELSVEMHEFVKLGLLNIKEKYEL
jgi:hypothetical protein